MTLCDPTSPATQQTLRAFVSALAHRGYGSTMLTTVLGPEGYAAMLAGNPAGAVWAVDHGDYAPDSVEYTCVAGVVLRRDLPLDQWRGIYGDVDGLLAAGVLEASPTDATRAHITVDIRPVAARGTESAEVLIVSDQDSSMTARTPAPNHVPGVGNAPLSLLSVLPPVSDAQRAGSPPLRVLDLGTGSGVLATVLATSHSAVEVTATDISSRALGFARCAFPQHASIDWVEGSWFEPVEGQLFDLIVSNPPFVIGPDCGLSYRETPLDFDGASRLVVEQAAQHLANHGTAHLLAAWALTEADSAASKVTGWIPGEDIRAWVVQRDLVDITTYVHTWLTDEGIDTRSSEGIKRTADWLDYFMGAGITHIGMGYVHMKRTTGTSSEVTFEVMDQALQPGTFLGHETREWFARAEWLDRQDAHSVLDTQYAARPTLALEHVSVSDGDLGVGFKDYALRLSRTDGPAWSHEVDQHVAAIVKGINPDGLTLRDTAELYAAVNGLDGDAFTDALAPIVVDLVRHGLILPADIVEEL
ncbi:MULTISPECIES: methyltransferase [Corynebacterium]|uniref:DUF7782 domain-containing protein n=1 Tax=Corynebacterium TaxID=1716 RepID=UPI001CE498EA|nr:MULTISPECIES: methyltransferase [Corynebacterium]